MSQTITLQVVGSVNHKELCKILDVLQDKYSFTYLKGPEGTSCVDDKEIFVDALDFTIETPKESDVQSKRVVKYKECKRLIKNATSVQALLAGDLISRDTTIFDKKNIKSRLRGCQSRTHQLEVCDALLTKYKSYTTVKFLKQQNDILLAKKRKLLRSDPHFLDKYLAPIYDRKLGAGYVVKTTTAIKKFDSFLKELIKEFKVKKEKLETVHDTKQRKRQQRSVVAAKNVIQNIKKNVAFRNESDIELPITITYEERLNLHKKNQMDRFKKKYNIKDGDVL